MTETEKARADDKPADAFSRVVEFLRKPGVIVTLLGFVGLKGQDVVAEVNTLLSMDLPAWTLLALVGGYVVARVGYNLLKRVASMADDLSRMREAWEEFRDWTRDQLAQGGEKFDALHDGHNNLDVRVSLIENVFRAEIAAYRENTKRETGKVK